MEKRFADLTVRVAALEAEEIQTKQDLASIADAVAQEEWRVSIEERLAALVERCNALEAKINENKIL